MSSAYVIDGMAVVQMKNAGSATFGELGNKYFQVITADLGNNGCNRVDAILIAMARKTRSRKQSVLEGGSSSSFEVRISGTCTPAPKKSQNSKPSEQEQPRGVSWQCVERDGTDKGCRGLEIGVGMVFH